VNTEPTLRFTGHSIEASNGELVDFSPFPVHGRKVADPRKYGPMFAAAPDMLAALELVERCVCRDAYERELVVIRAALAKAKGQP
jgi:hypothetical protein